MADTERGYRADLDGLRAIAILVVVAFHCEVSGFDGGFLGVDVFFVISGWLITAHLFEEVEASHRVALIEFWARRVRRLVPALALTTAVTIVLAAFVLSPLELPRVVADARSTLTYTSNLRFAQEAEDYFARGQGESLFLHTWSLGVEEQFYLVWPIALGLAAWVSRRRPSTTLPTTRLLLGAASLMSFVLALTLTSRGTPWSFFSLPTRLWEFGLAGLASTSTLLRAARPPAVASTLGVLGLASVAWSVVNVNATSAHPGFVTLPAVLGSIAVLLAGCSRNRVSRVLGVAPLRWIGRRSYSWYLWHWPLIILAVAHFHNDTAFLRVAASVAALAIGALTFRLVENPVRFQPSLVRSPSRTFIVGGAMTGVVALISAGTAAFGGANDDTPLLQRIAAAETADPGATDGCQSAVTSDGDPYCSYGNPESPITVVAIGDSHAEQWTPALATAAESLDVRVVVLARGGCPPADLPTAISATRRVVSAACSDHQALTRRVLAELAPGLVVISISDQASEVLTTTGGEPSPSEQRRLFDEGVADLFAEQRAAGRAVTFILDNPHPTEPPGPCAGRRGEVEPCVPSRTDALMEVAHLNELEAALLANERLPPPFDTVSELCDADRCQIDDGRRFFYSDGSHLSDEFVGSRADLLSDFLAERLPDR